jgi:predicted amidohydrolase YtcJ
VIQFVGSNDEVKASTDAELIDLNGGFMMPGIYDVHMYPIEAASESFMETDTHGLKHHMERNFPFI